MKIPLLPELKFHRPYSTIPVKPSSTSLTAISSSISLISNPVDPQLFKLFIHSVVLNSKQHQSHSDIFSSSKSPLHVDVGYQQLYYIQPCFASFLTTVKTIGLGTSSAYCSSSYHAAMYGCFQSS
mmetsp:Transcript_1821/g.2514  ORF Transcript_1821/g.2514 Transcript_1821/m.2514 type:complete len:125 (-) Transcript_1821:51-425(-)